MDRKKTSNLASGPETLSDIIKKSFQYRASWPDKEQFLDVIYWQRQVIGLILGIIFGIIPLTGIIALAVFFVINSALIYGYCASFQQIDDDEYGGIFELVKEGLMTSFSTFLVTWIAVYSGLFY